MTFSVGTTFVFGSWICKVDGDDKLRTRLQEEKEFDDEVQYKLAEKMTKLSTSDTTRNKEENEYETDSEKEIQPDSMTIFTAQEPSLIGLGDTTTIAKGYDPYNSKKNLGTYGLRNAASVYQHFTQNKMNSARRILLEGAQEGMIMTVTPQDCVVHWPGSFTSSKVQTSTRVEVIKREKNSDPVQNLQTAQPNERWNTVQEELGRGILYTWWSS